MQTSFVFTFVGNDRPGLVEAVSTAVRNCGGNWLNSRMSQLAGQFAGVGLIELPAENEASLRQAFDLLGDQGLDITLREPGHSAASTGSERTLAIVGLDRPGIVSEVTSAFNRHNINVLEFSTDITSAPMSGEPLFNAEVRVQVPAGTELEGLISELDKAAEELGVDIDLLDEAV